nr:MAG TPA: hypothetical protein [Caudoviricetes sp.]
MATLGLATTSKGKASASSSFEKQRIGDEPHSFARERHGCDRRGQASNGNGVVLQSVAMAWH